MISPPEPLSIIITPGHARRYVRIYTFLADLTRAGSALEKVDTPGNPYETNTGSANVFLRLTCENLESA